MQFYWHLLENMQMESNCVDNFEALYCTMALICIEMGGDEILVELFRLALDIQVCWSFISSRQDRKMFLVIVHINWNCANTCCFRGFEMFCFGRYDYYYCTEFIIRVITLT